VVILGGTKYFEKGRHQKLKKYTVIGENSETLVTSNLHYLFIYKEFFYSAFTFLEPKRRKKGLSECMQGLDIH